MRTGIRIEDKDLQAFGYPIVAVLVRPDPNIYYHWVVYSPDTNDTTAENILDDILRKYSGAWEKLAEM